ncbi:ABC transporter ATP-binding protein [Gemmobacter serpentinus]|uniref:ABC transporter ATP-binding protein n=1 Tax=Gemmobacter serpentinus TaxID=2652247 RepID=UPI00124F171F|nr:ABC transporter ATP-binding protein [Gemmobacter serpentinus]
MAAVILEARGLSRAFGGLRAVDGVDLTLTEGEIHALIGPNGAGKTTLVSLLSGRLAPDQGTIRFAGEDITRLPAQTRVLRGIAYTFQITSIYAGLTVFDNLALALQRRHRRDLADAVTQAATRIGLAPYLQTEAGTLSYGHQRLLEIGMGLALSPRLLILDEPTQGLANAEIEDFLTLIRGLTGTTILLIEHNMEVVMALAQRITVLNMGRVLASGTPDAIRADRAVQDAYLGGGHAAD